MPEGARVRLDPGYDLRSLSPAARVLARTLQVYGAFNRDVGNAFAFYLREPRQFRRRSPPWPTVARSPSNRRLRSSGA